MTATQYRAALAALGLTQAGAAELMDISTKQSNNYACGRWPVPRVVELLLSLLIKEAEETQQRLADNK